MVMATMEMILWREGKTKEEDEDAEGEDDLDTAGSEDEEIGNVY